MVLLAAALLTKSGKVLLSRQFMEMTRSRVEGLLAAFPKLVSSSTQHTFVETESVRYVYQPLEELYTVLLTTKTSNILEDLATLRLFCRVVQEYTKTLQEKDILDNAFTLIYAFDEIVCLGYRESVSMQMVRKYLEMDSQDEKIQISIREKQEQLAREEGKKREKELSAAMRKNKGATGVGSMSSVSSNPYSYQDKTPMVATTDTPAYRPKQTATRPVSQGKSLKLGSKNNDVDQFVDKLREEGAEVSSPSAGAAVDSNFTNTHSSHATNVQVSVTEVLTLTVTREMAVQNIELSGSMLVRVADDSFSKAHLILNRFNDNGLKFQLNPALDKDAFWDQHVVVFKQTGKAFLAGKDIAVVKWRLQGSDSMGIPLKVNCWLNEHKGLCEVSVDYEFDESFVELNNVIINIPLNSTTAAPKLGDMCGTCQYDAKKAVVRWTLPIIDGSNKTGSMEFTVGGRAVDVFPLSVEFTSSKTLCNIQVEEVTQSDTDSTSVRFTQERIMTVDKYNII